MNVRTPKAWESLPPAQRKKIEEHARNVAREQLEKDGRIMLDLYIKMVCVTLHDAFGFGEKRLNCFLGNHKRLFHDQQKKVKNNTQLDYLNERLTKIFRKNGFPQDLFDKMLGPVEVETEDPTDDT